MDHLQFSIYALHKAKPILIDILKEIKNNARAEHAVCSVRLSNNSGSRSLEMPVFKASDILPTAQNESRSDCQTEALRFYEETGMILVQDLFTAETIAQLNEHAFDKLEKGADPGDHFRKVPVATGKEGRGWCQRRSIRKRSPQLMSSILSASKKLQTLIFGNTNTTTEIQFNATYGDSIGHIHIDRPAGFLNVAEAATMPAKLLGCMNEQSFQVAFYTTGDTPREKGSTGFIPGSHKLLERGINSIGVYSTTTGKEYLSDYMLHGDIPAGLAIVFKSAVLHRTGSNKSGTTRVAYLTQNQLDCLVRMEGSVGEEKLEEYAVMLDYAKEDPWVMEEIYNRYPFPANLADPSNAPTNGYLTPTTILQHVKRDMETLLGMSVPQRKAYFKAKLATLHGPI